MAIISKAKQLLLNEARKIRTKIEGKKNEIKKLEATLSDLEKQANKLS